MLLQALEEHNKDHQWERMLCFWKANYYMYIWRADWRICASCTCHETTYFSFRMAATTVWWFDQKSQSWWSYNGIMVIMVLAPVYRGAAKCTLGSYAVSNAPSHSVLQMPMQGHRYKWNYTFHCWFKAWCLCHRGIWEENDSSHEIKANQNEVHLWIFW